MKNISLVLCFKEICMISLCCTFPWRLASHKVETDRSGFVLMHIPYSLLQRDCGEVCDTLGTVQ